MHRQKTQTATAPTTQQLRSIIIIIIISDYYKWREKKCIMNTIDSRWDCLFFFFVLLFLYEWTWLHTRTIFYNHPNNIKYRKLIKHLKKKNKIKSIRMNWRKTTDIPFHSISNTDDVQCLTIHAHNTQICCVFGFGIVIRFYGDVQQPMQKEKKKIIFLWNLTTKFEIEEEEGDKINAQ